MKDGVYNSYDLEAAKILDDFLPARMWDMHMHISHLPEGPYETLNLATYYKDMKPLIGDRELKVNAIVWPERELWDEADMTRSVDFLASELAKFPGNMGEVVVRPGDSVEEIEKRLVHPDIRGFKCYHCFADRERTFDAGIEEYLPETAWEIADKKRMFITLHMVKDKAMADEANVNYIRAMAKKYPNAILILAHAARSFAAWTAFGNVDKVADLENVWYDFSAVCESPAMMHIMKKVGVKRCMWGSDYTVSIAAGKCVSLGDTFYWIGEKDLQNFQGKTTFHSYHVGTENLMAVRQACELLDLSRTDVEDLFYNNAATLLK